MQNGYRKFFHISVSNEPEEKKIKKNTILLKPLPQTSYIGTNFTKDVKDLYISNCKSLLTDIERTQENGSTFHVPGLEWHIFFSEGTELSRFQERREGEEECCSK